MSYTKNKTTPEQATKLLSKDFPEIKELVKNYGVCKLSWRKDRNTHFASLVETICHQQLAGKAARTIHGKVLIALGNVVTPESLLEIEDIDLREAGLSQNKLLSMKSLTDHVLSKKLKLNRIGSYDDEEIINQLIQVRGIGRWSAQMFLMDKLQRIDIWPCGDFGVRAGAKYLFELNEMPTEKQMINMADKYKPYRSVIAWYCWKLADDNK